MHGKRITLTQSGRNPFIFSPGTLRPRVTLRVIRGWSCRQPLRLPPPPPPNHRLCAPLVVLRPSLPHRPSTAAHRYAKRVSISTFPRKNLLESIAHFFLQTLQRRISRSIDSCRDIRAFAIFIFEKPRWKKKSPLDPEQKFPREILRRKNHGAFKRTR